MPQQTFHLIPTTLVRTQSVAHKPMTSKAAKEAYRKSSRTTKISRAEQRRLDALEIKRQKEDHEKERNREKARLAREKKSDKERREKEERKKRGEPEPKRGVRASQSTIKGFVVQSFGKRGWEDVSVEPDADSEEPPRKVRALERVDEPEQDEFGEFSALSTAEMPAKVGAFESQEDEDEFGDFPSLSQCDGVFDGKTALDTNDPPVDTKVLDQPVDEEDFGDFPSLSQIMDGVGYEKGAVQTKECSEQAPANKPDGADVYGDFLGASQGVYAEDQTEKPAVEAYLASSEIRVMAQPDGDDDFGDFPILSQTDLGLLDTRNVEHRAERNNLSHRQTVNSKSRTSSQHVHLCRGNLSQKSVQSIDRDDLHFQVESQLLLEVSEAAQRFQPVQQQLVKPKVTNASFPKSFAPNITKQDPSKIGTRNQNIKPDTMLSAFHAPKTANNGSSRTPLRQISRNMPPPPPPHPPTKPSSFRPNQQMRAPLRKLSVPPPSTMAFLEAHMDDFFPNPSQQVRELLENIDDIPSKKQIAREIDSKYLPVSIPSNVSQGPRIIIQPPRSTSKQATTNIQAAKPVLKQDTYLDLLLFSSQDLEISSQDLRDIDTPSKDAASNTPFKRASSSHHDLGLHVPSRTYDANLKPSSNKPKSRFFEEKEDDLLQAALRESLVMAREEAKRSEEAKKACREHNKASERTVSETETGYGDEDEDDDKAFGDEDEWAFDDGWMVGLAE